MGFTIKKLPEICEIKTGKRDANHATQNGKYRFYTCANQYSFCDTFSFSGKSVIVPGNGDIGLVFYYDGEFEAYQRTYVLQNISIDAKYLYYHLLYKWRHINSGKQYGSTVRYVRMSNFTSYTIPVPSEDEQKRIVAKIEELFSELDNGVETLKKIKQQLAVYRQAVLKEAFDISNFPRKKLQDLCYFITKGTTPPKKSMTNYTGEIPFIKVYNLTFDNTLDFTIEPTFVDNETHNGFLERSICVPGDVLMNIVGPPMGKVSIIPAIYSQWNINQAIARFRCLDILDNKYLAYFLGYSGTVEKMKSQAKATAGQFNLTLEICRNIEIPVPPIEKQKEIVFEIETQLSQQENIEKTVDTALQQAEAMRQSILKKAFKGEL